VSYDQNITKVSIPTDEANLQNNRDPLAFARWQVFLGVRLFW